MEVTEEEYNKALLTIAHYEAQYNRTVQVTVDYDVKISATVSVPDEWSIKEIKEELKDNYYSFQHTITDEPHMKFLKMTRLIVNGVEIKLPKKK